MPKSVHHYIGTKEVLAEPMTHIDFLRKVGHVLPDNVEGSEPGYVVQYLDGGKANFPDLYPLYVSWSPKDVFERAYKLKTPAAAHTGMSFSEALEKLKDGMSLCRKGWNGANQFIYLLTGQEIQRKMGYGFGEYMGEPEWQRTIVLHNAQRGLVMGWVPSTGDLFANDWVLTKAEEEKPPVAEPVVNVINVSLHDDHGESARRVREYAEKLGWKAYNDYMMVGTVTQRPGPSWQDLPFNQKSTWIEGQIDKLTQPRDEAIANYNGE